MSGSVLLGMATNAAILLALGVLYDILPTREGPATYWSEIATGVGLAGVGIVLMLTPWELAPGVFFDTRSILLSISGLFFGLIPTAIAVVGTAAFRLYQGGTGALTAAP